MRKLKVVIEVSGGVAEVTECPDGVEVEIIDHDNLEAEYADYDVDGNLRAGVDHGKR